MGLRSILCAVGLFAFGTFGCAAEADENVGDSESAISACGYNVLSTGSARALLNSPFHDAADAEIRFDCLKRILNAQRDRRAPFATLYTNTTRAIRRAIREGRMNDAEWSEKLLTKFAELYRVSFVAYADGHEDDVPRAWRYAFEEAAKAHEAQVAHHQEEDLILQHLMLGVNAHVNHDLAHAVAEVGLAGESAGERKKDFDVVRDILHENVNSSFDLVIEMYAKHLGETPKRMRDIMGKAFFAWLYVGREKAWKDAQLLIHGGLRGTIAKNEIEFSSAAIAKLILVPNLDKGLLEKLRRFEGSQP